MVLNRFSNFNKSNLQILLLLISCHLVWACTVLSLWSFGRLINVNFHLWGIGFMALQLYLAAQLLLPAIHQTTLRQSIERSRFFYLFWAVTLALSIWLVNQLTLTGLWLPIIAVIKSALLMLVATLIGAVLAKYVNRLWEILPVCIVMTLADIASWLVGPTAGFVEQIEHYYRAPTGPAPLIDMVLIKLASPGFQELTPAFGISDWIMVVFFAIVAHRFGVNDNLLGQLAEKEVKQGRFGCYLPVSVAALFVALVLAQLTGLFVPALPFIALIMLPWYALRYLLIQKKT